MRKAIIAMLPAVVLALLVCGCSKSPEPPAEPAAEVTQESAVDATLVDDAAMSDETAGENWLAFGRTYSEQRFSPLDQINDVNVSGLGVDWYLDLPEDRGLVSTPLVVDGVLYFIGSMNRVRAVDATNGELLWQFDPDQIGFDNRQPAAFQDLASSVRIADQKADERALRRIVDRQGTNANSSPLKSLHHLQ